MSKFGYQIDASYETGVGTLRGLASSGGICIMNPTVHIKMDTHHFGLAFHPDTHTHARLACRVDHQSTTCRTHGLGASSLTPSGLYCILTLHMCMTYDGAGHENRDIARHFDVPFAFALGAEA